MRYRTIDNNPRDFSGVISCFILIGAILCIASAVKTGIECVEVLRIKIILNDAQSFTKSGRLK